jgi:hypothetical protein
MKNLTVDSRAISVELVSINQSYGEEFQVVHPWSYLYEILGFN